MSLNKPFPHVWWCNFSSVTTEAIHQSACLISVADNVPDIHRKLLPNARFKPWFLLPHDENKEISDEHLIALLGVARIAGNNGWLPLTVYCWAGQHRSPAACAVINACLFGGSVESCIVAVTKLWPDFVRHRNGVYASSLIRRFKELYEVQR